MTVDVEEIVMPPPPPMKKKRERASGRQREREGGSICECTRRHMIYGGEKRIEPKRANIQNYVLHNMSPAASYMRDPVEKAIGWRPPHRL